jgi:hypothetical protein
MRCQPFLRFFWNSNDTSSMNSEGPLMRARNHNIRTSTVQHNAPSACVTSTAIDGVRRQTTNHFVKRIPDNAMSVVETHQRNLNEACLFKEALRIQRPRSFCAFIAKEGSARSSQPRRDTRRKIEIRRPPRHFQLIEAPTPEDYMLPNCTNRTTPR